MWKVATILDRTILELHTHLLEGASAINRFSSWGPGYSRSSNILSTFLSWKPNSFIF